MGVGSRGGLEESSTESGRAASYSFTPLGSPEQQVQGLLAQCTALLASPRPRVRELVGVASGLARLGHR